MMAKTLRNSLAEHNLLELTQNLLKNQGATREMSNRDKTILSKHGTYTLSADTRQAFSGKSKEKSERELSDLAHAI